MNYRALDRKSVSVTPMLAWNMKPFKRYEDLASNCSILKRMQSFQGMSCASLL